MVGPQVLPTLVIALPQKINLLSLRWLKFPRYNKLRGRWFEVIYFPFICDSNYDVEKFVGNLKFSISYIKRSFLATKGGLKFEISYYLLHKLTEDVWKIKQAERSGLNYEYCAFS